LTTYYQFGLLVGPEVLGYYYLIRLVLASR
jgi:hypothetical protein